MHQITPFKNKFYSTLSPLFSPRTPPHAWISWAFHVVKNRSENFLSIWKGINFQSGGSKWLSICRSLEDPGMEIRACDSIYSYFNMFSLTYGASPAVYYYYYYYGRRPRYAWSCHCDLSVRLWVAIKWCTRVNKSSYCLISIVAGGQEMQIKTRVRFPTTSGGVNHLRLKIWFHKQPRIFSNIR